MALPSDREALAELTARLALWRIKGVGPCLFRRLLQQLGPARHWLRSSSPSVPAALAALTPTIDWPGVESDLCWLSGSEHHHMVWADALSATLGASLPPALSAIAQAPPLLFVRGNIDVLAAKQMAMVGSRKPSAYGLSVARDLASQLATLGVVITSGLAIGIDSECQRSALAVGGRSIGVLALGLDRVYPKQHTALAEQLLAAGGALVSEFPIGTPPLPQHFPRRNRLISGLSAGVIVVEAALKSGSLITARYGADQGREVFAVPGPIRYAAFQGCHALIKDGAHLLESLNDIWVNLPELLDERLFITIPPPVSLAGADLTVEERKLLAVLEATPLAFDEIHQRLPWPAPMLSGLLTSLLLKGYLSQESNGYYLSY